MNLQSVSQVGDRSFSSAAWKFALLCFLITFVFFCVRLQVSREEIPVNDCVLGTDAATYSRGFDQGNWTVFRTKKHPLAVIMAGALIRPLAKIGLPWGLATDLSLSFVLAAGVCALFLFLRAFLPDGLSAVAALLPVSAFAPITIFSVVETYGVTFAAVCFALASFVPLARLAPRSPITAGVGAGVVAGLVGWANLPGVAFVLVYCALAFTSIAGGIRSKILVSFFIPVAVGVALTTLPTVRDIIRHGPDWQIGYINTLASLSHFVDSRILSDYLFNFFVFTFVSPLDYIKWHYTPADAGTLMASISRAACSIAWSIFLLIGIARALANQGTRDVALAFLAVACAVFAFYLYFNPVDALLYSPQWILALVLPAALGWNARPALLLGTTLLLVSIGVNAPPLHNHRTGDASSCCDVEGGSEPKGALLCQPLLDQMSKTFNADRLNSRSSCIGDRQSAKRLSSADARQFGYGASTISATFHFSTWLSPVTSAECESNPHPLANVD